MRKLILLMLSLILSSWAVAHEVFLANKINNLIASDANDASIGILVKDQKTGKVLYSQNTNHYFAPASNEKLFTAFAALQYLGGDYTYKTQLFTDSNNVYLQFSGDPTLTLDQLDTLIQALAATGVRQINGDIVIDDSAFDQMLMSPGSTWDDKNYCWGAPTSAIIINGNCVTATLTPATTIGQSAPMTLPNYPQSMRFINNVVTGTDTNCEIKVKRENNISYLLKGCIPTNAQPVNVATAIENPRENIQFLLVYLLGKNHIAGPYHFTFAKILSTPKLIATVNSKPLSDLVNTMLKESDNTIADALFKTIGATYSKESGSFQNGSDAERAILLQTLRLNIPKTTLIDGSGASRYNFFTPEQIVRLLEGYQTSKYAETLTAALPIGGTDGTLKARMTDPATRGKVHAKTGTETAVSTLSGYIVTQKNHKLIFSIMVNGFVDTPKKYQALQDKICKILIENA